MEKIQELLRPAKILFWGLVLFFSITLFTSYSNHFHNGFQFDDFHTIVQNTYIQDLSNIPGFFKDNSMMSTNLNNRSYRPVVAVLNAIDYRLGGLDPFWFHVSIFTSYILLVVLLYFFIFRIFTLSIADSWVPFFTLFAVAFYGFHAANAETINYIIARSDSFSTLCIVATLFMYQNAFSRRTMLYLIPMIVGIYTKQVGVVAVPLLFMYIYFFEENLTLSDGLLLRNRTGLLRVLKKTFPAIVLGIGIFYVNQIIMTKGLSANLLRPMSTSRWDYFSTQWYVIAHYIGNFILPVNLSADPDIKLIHGLFNVKKLLGLTIILVLFFIAFKTSNKKETRPISFGILWFFISLFPTSTFHPLGQISNDHRTFLPYIGLVISVSWSISLIAIRYKDKLLKSTLLSVSTLLILTSILMGHAVGTHNRNLVWNSSETLWKDVAEKSPNNGRGLMNYGLSLMSKGQYPETLDYFERALKLLPTYSYLHINLGILKDAMGNPEEAERYHLNSIQYDKSNVEAYYYYARFLWSKNRTFEALDWAKKGLEISPGHAKLNSFYRSMREKTSNSVVTPSDNKSVKNLSANDYINLSLELYNQKLYEQCIHACIKALELNPKLKEAYNNIGIANIQLKKIDEAIEALNNALALDPEFELAKNNLKWAQSLKNK